MSNLPHFNFSQWLFGTLQRQLALTFSSISLLMVSGLTALLLHQQRNFLDQESILRASALSNGLARSSTSWVLANDLVGLSEVIDAYRDTPNLQRAFILSPKGEVLASTQKHEVGLFVNDPVSLTLLSARIEPNVLIANDDLIDVAAPIMLGQRHIGWVRIALNQEATRANLHAVVLTSLQFILLEAFLVMLVSGLLAKKMSRRLQQLVDVAQKITRGDRSSRAETLKTDEIGYLANNINKMLDTIACSEQQLDRLNHVYAAWTESVAAIVRETDEIKLLNYICKILAEKIGFRLVFIAMVESSGSVCLVASSDWQLPYFKNLKVSIDGSLPEGRGPIGRSIREQTPQIFNDYLDNPFTAHWHQTAREADINSVAAFPLKRSGQVIGSIGVYSSELNFFTDDINALLNGLANDISFALDNFDHEQQRRQAETELALAASVFDNSQEGILITDANELIVRVNTMFCQLTGYSAEDVIGQTPALLASGQHEKVFYQAMWDSIHNQGFWQGETISRRKDGSLYTEWLTVTQVTDKADVVTHYVAAFSDITERKLNEARIYKLAFYDPLTQLPNRRLLVEKLREAMVTHQRSQHYGALMFMDLDRFKILNDTQGHDMGDQLLIDVAKRINNSVREQDTVARLGGDEFVIILADLSDTAASAAVFAQRVGNKLLDALNQPYVLHRFDKPGYASAVEHHSTASIGLTLFHGTRLNSEDLLKQADMAMYKAKQLGRNTLCVFDPDMQTSLNERTALEADMRQALQCNQFCLHYQVQVNQQRQAVGAEVLLCWEHPQRGIIAPIEFIRLAEETGLIAPLGLWVLMASCKTLVAWAKRPETADLILAVNVSAKQFAQATFVGQLADILQTTGINPARLKLEITESSILDNVDNTIAIMHALGDLGLSFSMDDFGTGYSSLSYLQRLPLGQIKIDRSFVRDLTEDSNDAAIIRTILALGKSLELVVIAEGVETDSQYAYLTGNGCEFFQGYLFGKPVPLLEFEQQLSRNQSGL
ncbi:MAG: EAL domain-containing protein [Methylovulum sp.]|nr:EAL domain-containing protein [Methylovulum sp.]